MTNDAIMTMDRQERDTAELNNYAMLSALWAEHPERMRTVGAMQPVGPKRRPTNYITSAWHRNNGTTTNRFNIERDRISAERHITDRQKVDARKIEHREACFTCGAVSGCEHTA